MKATTEAEREQRRDEHASGAAVQRRAAPGKRTRTEDAGPAPGLTGGDRRAGSPEDRADDWVMTEELSAALGLVDPAAPAPAPDAAVQRKASAPSVSSAPSTSSAARPVQARGELTGADIGAVAERGVAQASSPLPHLETIQQAFGHHDVSGVRAQVGGEGATASQAIGAQAYATGDRVAFASAPDLHTAAHEAAHVVQQAAGVHLKDGVGQAGDAYEQHADAVADAVVAGRSAQPLLDAFAPAGAAAGGAQRKAVQRVVSDYKSAVDLKAMTLRAFDRYAHTQADWAISATLGADKEPLRKLLALARKSEDLVLGACGDFGVDAMLTATIGSGGAADADLVAYSRAAGVGTNAGTIHVEVPATSIADAIAWGAAIRKLTAAINGLILEEVIPQNGTYQGLKRLVDKNAVDDLVAYYQAVKPLLSAKNGMEVISYLAFRDEGGQAKFAGYKANLPEIRNHHRFTVAQLDALIGLRTAAATNATQVAPLPISVVLQTALDHNGAFHRDPNLTAVINRPGYLTLIAEGKDSLGAFSTELTRFAAFGKDGKVDEVMIGGHGNAKLMELAGDKGIGQTRSGDTIYGNTKNQRVTVDKSDASGMAATDTFIQSVAAVLRDDPNSRIVLNACLTASNSVDGIVLDPDPVVAAQQVKNAIASDPSLATAMKTKLGANQAQVRGANASFGQVSLLDGGDHIDIVSADDPKLTAPKLEYAEAGTEPTGVMRAILESWATDKVATIDALKRRLLNKSADTSWREKIICALVKIVVANQDDAALINTFTGTAGALSHLANRPECSVGRLKGKVPAAHLPAIFADLTTSALWADAGYNFVPAVVYQVWLEQDNGKINDFLTFLNTSTFTTRDAAPFLDQTLMKPFLAQLVPAPLVVAPPPRGPFLIALLHLVTEGETAPTLCKDYIKAVVGVGGQAFPPAANVGDVLKGASEQSVLEDAGVVQRAVAAPIVALGAVAPTPNLAPTGIGDNTLLVDSMTATCRTYGFTSTNAYMLPAGTKIGTIPSGTALNIIGRTTGKAKGMIKDDPNANLYAVEHTIGVNKTVFVKVNDVRMT